EMMQNANEKKDMIMEKVEEISSVSEETSAVSEQINATTEFINSQLGIADLSFQTLKTLTDELTHQVSQFKI
ncbi:MAG: hypothetical protein H7X94_09065, partial [Vallitaleaceae bacterium]|nr:hypothetical protein [Vallitaleaceae bacterium]